MCDVVAGWHACEHKHRETEREREGRGVNGTEPTRFDGRLELLKVLGHFGQHARRVATDCREFGEHPFQFSVDGIARIV